MFPRSERKIVVVLDNVKAFRGARGGVGLGGSVVGNRIASGSLSLRIDEHRVVDNDFGGISVLSLLIAPFSYLDRTGNADSGTFLEEPGNELRGLSPCNAVDEVGDLLLVVFV